MPPILDSTLSQSHFVKMGRRKGARVLLIDRYLMLLANKSNDLGFSILTKLSSTASLNFNDINQFIFNQ